MMKNKVCVFLLGNYVFLMAAFSVTAAAQDAPNIEIFGGYAFARQGDWNARAGWNGSVTGNLTRAFGIVVDASGHYPSRNVIDLPGYVVNSSGNILAYRVGPQFTLRAERFAVFAHGLAGLARMKLKGNVRSGSATVSVSETDRGLALAVGGGFDIPLSPRTAFRTQLDYSHLSKLAFPTFGGPGDITSRGLRFATGVAFTF